MDDDRDLPTEADRRAYLKTLPRPRTREEARRITEYVMTEGKKLPPDQDTAARARINLHTLTALDELRPGKREEQG